MFQYQIKSRYVPTGRMRTINIKAQNKEDAVAYMRRDSNFIEPYEIEESFIPPTDSQLEYAKKLKIKVIGNASMYDVSAMINMAVNDDSVPNPDLVEFAHDQGFLFSKYIGKKALYNLIFSGLSNEDRIAFFIFSVYRWVSDDRAGNLDKHPYKETFYEFACKNISNDKFMASMNKYRGEDIRYFGKIIFNDGGEDFGGSTNTIAYKNCMTFLSEKFSLKNKTVHKFNNKSNQHNGTQKRGCAGVLLLILIPIISILYWAL